MLTSLTIQATLPLPQREYRPKIPLPVSRPQSRDSPHARAKAPQVIELAASGRTRAEIAPTLEISERSVYRILAETRSKAT